MLTWHFVAPMVHDFGLLTKKNYMHDIVKDQMMLTYFLYKTIRKLLKMEKIAAYDGQCNGFFNKNGNYPYKQYSFIQGGDGGMEYAMSDARKWNS
jgi:hypothetical protein